jgi:hypothetical protein
VALGIVGHIFINTDLWDEQSREVLHVLVVISVGVDWLSVLEHDCEFQLVQAELFRD